ncbi:MAG TPA: hypothetical protein VMU99_08615 [Acidimicrobiales bacterium]|nr:hypothetical protein [Acidimicrobiales bacterium]
MPKPAGKGPGARVKVPRKFVPGSPIDTTPGNALNVALLGFDAGELYGVDLASRAFLRLRLRENEPRPVPDDAANQGHDIRQHRIGDVYRIVLEPGEPLDAGRPEALWANELPARIGNVTRRGLRRICSQVMFRERAGALVLGSRARSISYADLDASDPSMMLVALHSKSCRLFVDNSGKTLLSFTWGGLEQSLTVRDPRTCAIARAHQGHPLEREELKRALGFKIGFALFGYTRVKDRYVEKVVISLLGH